MGQHKHNPTAIAAAKGELPPKKREQRLTKRQAEKRLCRLAAKETREAVKMMCCLVIDKLPEFKGLFAAHCAKYGDCDEMKPCETGRRLQGGNNSCD